MIAARTQIDRWRVVISVQAGQPAGALPKPAHLIDEPVRDGVPAVQFRIITGIGVFRGRPARRPQLTQRRVQLIEAGGGHDLVHPGGREPDRGGERANGHGG